MRSVLLLAATVLSQVLAPLPGPASGAETLPGVWEGRRIVSEAGDCELTGERASKQPVELTVRRNDDGTFTARLSPPPPPGPDEPFEWTGRIDGERIEFWTQKAARCDGRSERYLLKTSGDLPVARDGQVFMRLRAIDPACGCAFRETYELTLKSAAPPE